MPFRLRTSPRGTPKPAATKGGGEQTRTKGGRFGSTSGKATMENYLSEYICKEETSMDDITNLFANIVKCADPGTSFRTLALQLQMKMLKRKHLASAEAHTCAVEFDRVAKFSHGDRHVSWRQRDQIDPNRPQIDPTTRNGWV
jgi:hypothetical protein